VHAIEPVEVAWVITAQAVHNDAPAAALNIPIAQGVHVAAVASEYAPAAHALQLFDPVTFWFLPALQFKQVVIPLLD